MVPHRPHLWGSHTMPIPAQLGLSRGQVPTRRERCRQATIEGFRSAKSTAEDGYPSTATAMFPTNLLRCQTQLTGIAEGTGFQENGRTES